MNPNERMLFRIPEAAEKLGLSRTKTYELVNAGVIPSVRIGSSLRIPAKQLQAWIDEQTSHKVAA